jgi:nicotinamidase-related amidase
MIYRTGHFRERIKSVSVQILKKEHTGIVVVDIQVKLMAVMRRKEVVIENIKRLLSLSKLYNLPVVLTEQYPRMMGSTMPEISEALTASEPIEKMDFNCCAVEDFNERLESTGLRNIILSGVETHVCILQTCLSLLDRGYVVHVPQDGVDSRTEENWHVGLELMRQAGAVITSTETVVFQFLKKAGTGEFKEMLKIIK